MPISKNCSKVQPCFSNRIYLRQEPEPVSYTHLDVYKRQVVYELNYSSEDKDLMDLLRTKAEELARQVNPGAANNSDRKSTRLNSSHSAKSRMPSSA